MKPGPKRKIVVDPQTGCHIPATNARCSTGYPQYKHGGRRIQAARAIWLEQRGPIPEGFQIDHLCRNRECVNVEHLEPVTAVENVRRARTTRLTVEKVAAILASGERGRDLAERFGVSQATISLIRHRRTWVDVEPLKSQGRA